MRKLLRRRYVIPLHILIELATAIAFGAAMGTFTVFWLIGP
jgi:hypothetical protein